MTTKLLKTCTKWLEVVQVMTKQNKTNTITTKLRYIQMPGFKNNYKNKIFYSAGIIGTIKFYLDLLTNGTLIRVCFKQIMQVIRLLFLLKKQAMANHPAVVYPSIFLQEHLAQECQTFK